MDSKTNLKAGSAGQLKIRLCEKSGKTVTRLLTQNCSVRIFLCIFAHLFLGNFVSTILPTFSPATMLENFSDDANA